MKNTIKVLLIMFIVIGGLSAGLYFLIGLSRSGSDAGVVAAKDVTPSPTPTEIPKQPIVDMPEIFLPIEESWWAVSREDRARIIYETICISGGWWGDGCPTEMDINAWILFEEGETLHIQDEYNMARGIRYRFDKYGNTPEKFVHQLSAFTSFYNADGDEDLDIDDWNALLRPPDMTHEIQIVKEVYSVEVVEQDGQYMYWFSEAEVITTKGHWPGPYIETNEPGVGLFYFTGIPDVRTCAIENKNCK